MKALAKPASLAVLACCLIVAKAPAHAQVAPTRVRLSEGVARGLLAWYVAPVYPEPAKRKGIEGLVKLRVVVSKNGDVKFVSVISGDAALTDAAVTAVKQWRFMPYRLNGEPIEARIELTIPFHRNQK
jgi:protein TonB